MGSLDEALLSKRDEGKGPAHIAAMAGDIVALQAVLPESTKEEWRGMLPIHTAAANNRLPVLDFLLTCSSASINAQDQGGRTPLMHAIAARQPEACVWLVRRGCDTSVRDHRGMMAVHWCAQAGFVSIIALLANLGLDIESKGTDGRTPLEIAVLHKHIAFTEYLVLKHGSSRQVEEAARALIQPGPLAFWFQRCLDAHVGCHEAAPGDPPCCGPLVGGWQVPCVARCLKEPEHVDVKAKLFGTASGIVGILSSLLLLRLSSYPWQQHVCVATLLASILLSTVLVVATRLCGPGSVDSSEPCLQERYFAALDRVAAVSASDNDAFLRRTSGNWWGETSPVIHQLSIVGPPRSKYCSATRQCVPVYDHYCAFLRMPIGRNNYALFIGITVCSVCISIGLTLVAKEILMNSDVGNASILVTIVLTFSGLHSFMWIFLLVTHVLQCHLGNTTNELLQAQRHGQFPAYLLDEEGAYSNPYRIGCLRTAWGRLCPKFGDERGGF